MNEDRILITKKDLINQGFMITKKFVVIDSTLYTPEAFEYIQELITYSGSILFVADTKKIFARGKYFGGDIFEADLLYFTSFHTVSETGITTGVISAKHPKSVLEIHAKDHITTNAVYDETTGQNQLHIGYDLDRSVNTESFTIDQNAEYNLTVENGQIKMAKYIPCKVNMSALPLLEYDSGDTTVLINLTTSGSLPLIEMESTTDLGIEYIDLEKSSSSQIYGIVPNNTDVTFIVHYSDGRTTGQTSVKQVWGYGVFYGTYEYFDELTTEINSEFLESFSKYIITNNPSKTIVLEQDGGKYGWFMCPSEFPVVFTDASTNLQGGWRKISTFNYYGFNTEYSIYRTDHTGLGRVKWIISNK